MEDYLNLSEDFLDLDFLMENNQMLDEGCKSGRGDDADYSDANLDEDEVIFDDDDELDDDELVSETELDLRDIEDDYNTYSESSDLVDFDALLEAEEVEINVNLFSEDDEDLVGADTLDLFLI